MLGPLGMVETAFCAAEADHGRLAALYTPDPETGRATRSPMSAAATRPPDVPVRRRRARLAAPATTSASPRMLLRGGELDGVRLLGPRTLRLMASNHLPGHADLEAFGRPLFAETTFDGVGFGLGFSVVEDPIAGRYPCSPGEFGWGGAASTAFWVDPVERLDGAVLHPAAAVEHLSDPLAAAPARPPGARRLAGGDELGADAPRAAPRGRRAP